VDANTAFLREVIEERYVSGFGMHMPYYPERMPYAATELNSNSNAPAEDPGIFTKTEVNQ